MKKIKSKRKPKIGVPWRTAVEEAQRRHETAKNYLRAVREAGGEPVQISLGLAPAELERVAQALDGFVLPGSPSDVEPRRFGKPRHPAEAVPDKRREHTDDRLLNHAFATGKPVLAICYGAQLLNVHQHGSIVQDIASELPKAVDHDGGAAREESLHRIRIHSGRLAELAGNSTARVNSSHHQAVGTAGRGLRVAARAADGVIEAVEWAAGPEWVVGVQWHPERMPDDPFATALFSQLVKQAQGAGKGSKAPKKRTSRGQRAARRSKSKR